MTSTEHQSADSGNYCRDSYPYLGRFLGVVIPHATPDVYRSAMEIVRVYIQRTEGLQYSDLVPQIGPTDEDAAPKSERDTLAAILEAAFPRAARRLVENQENS